MNPQTFNKLSPEGQRMITEMEERISHIHEELDMIDEIIKEQPQ